MTKELLVDGTEGLWDEETRPRWCVDNINDRRVCLCHKWVHGRLVWVEKSSSCSPDAINDLDNLKDVDIIVLQESAEFCLNCKRIKCVHILGEKIIYKQIIAPRCVDIFVVQRCRRCEKRILTELEKRFLADP